MDQCDSVKPLSLPRVGVFLSSIAPSESVYNPSPRKGMSESCNVPPPERSDGVRPTAPAAVTRTQTSDVFSSTVNVWIAPSGASLSESKQSEVSAIKDLATPIAVNTSPGTGKTRSSGRHRSGDESNAATLKAWSTDEIILETQLTGTSTSGSASQLPVKLQTGSDGHHQATHTTIAGNKTIEKNKTTKMIPATSTRNGAVVATAVDKAFLNEEEQRTVLVTPIVNGAAVANASAKEFADEKELGAAPAAPIANDGAVAVAGINDLVTKRDQSSFLVTSAANGGAVNEAVASLSPSEANPEIPQRRSPPRHGSDRTAGGQVMSIETEATDELCVVLHSYTHQRSDELDLCRGDLIRVRLRRSDGWSAGRIVRCAADTERAKAETIGTGGETSSHSVEGQRGMFPSNRVARTTAPLAWERSQRSKAINRHRDKTADGSGTRNVQLCTTRIDQWDQGFEVDDPASQSASPKHESQSWMPVWRKKHQMEMLAQSRIEGQDPHEPQLSREQYQLLMLRRYQDDVEEEEEGHWGVDEDLQSLNDIQSHIRQELQPPPLPLPMLSECSKQKVPSDVKTAIENTEQAQLATRTVSDASSSRLASCADEHRSEEKPVAQVMHAAVMSPSDDFLSLTKKPIACSSLVVTAQEHCQPLPLAAERDISDSEGTLSVRTQPPEPTSAPSRNTEVTLNTGQFQPWRRDLEAQQQNRFSERHLRCQDEAQHTHAHEEQQHFQLHWRKQRQHKHTLQSRPEFATSAKLLPSSIQNNAALDSNTQGGGVEPPPCTWKASFRLPSSHSSDGSASDNAHVVIAASPHASSQRNQAHDEASLVDTHHTDQKRIPELAPAEPASSLVTPVRLDLGHRARRDLHTPPSGPRLIAEHNTIPSATAHGLTCPRSRLSKNESVSNVNIANPHLATINVAAAPGESFENLASGTDADTRCQEPNSARKMVENSSLGSLLQSPAISHVSKSAHSKPTLTQRFMEAVNFTLSGCVSESLASSQLQSEVGQLRNQLQNLNRGLVENTCVSAVVVFGWSLCLSKR